ncbi:MAG: glycosyltransferase [Candidatus Diapherotrites archaeon]
MKRLSLILPTYNESENIRKLVPQLEAFFKKNRLDAEILVVDDNSPDKTWKVAQNLNKKYGNIRVLRRKQKEGVGAALKEAYDKANAKILLSMDADLALEVEEIALLLKEIDSGHDMVIGSRFEKGSFFEKKSNIIKLRGIISDWGNKYLSLITCTPVSDFSLNFRAMKSEVWKKIKPTDKRNFFLAEMIIQAKIAGFKVKSVPATFRERSYGESKTKVANQFFVFFFKALKYAFPLQWVYRKR